MTSDDYSWLRKIDDLGYGLDMAGPEDLFKPCIAVPRLHLKLPIAPLLAPVNFAQHPLPSHIDGFPLDTCELTKAEMKEMCEEANARVEGKWNEYCRERDERERLDPKRGMCRSVASIAAENGVDVPHFDVPIEMEDLVFFRQFDVWEDHIQWGDTRTVQYPRASHQDLPPTLNSHLIEGELEWLGKVIHDATTSRVPSSRLGSADDKTSVCHTPKTAAPFVLDDFNVSLDQHYQHDVRKLVDESARVEKLQVTHDAQALDMERAEYQTRWIDNNIGCSQRPRLDFETLGNDPQIIHITDGQQDQDHEHGIPRQDVCDMSTNGQLVMLEYLEHTPLFTTKVGMSSRIVTYVRAEAPDDSKKTDNQPPTMPARPGEVVHLSINEASPFGLGDVPATNRPVQVMTNHLFTAPISMHRAPLSRKTAVTHLQQDLYCTFLLVRSGDGWQLRSLPDSFVVGQQQPRVEIPAPHSIEAQTLQLRVVRGAILRFLLNHKRLRMDHMVELMGVGYQSAIHRTVKQLCVYDRDTGMWSLDPQYGQLTRNQVREVCTPEDVCVYESMMRGKHALQQMGINSFDEPDSIGALVDRFENKTSGIVAAENRRAWAVGTYIKRMLETTPWHLARGYCQFVYENKGAMQQEGWGNPLPHGYGFSYVPTKNVNRKKQDESQLPKELQEVKKKTGTGADMRRMKKKQLFDELRRFGHTDSEIKAMGRWDRVRMVAQHHTEVSHQGNVPDKPGFIRHGTQTLSVQKQTLKKRAQKIFLNQLALLATSTGAHTATDIEDNPYQLAHQQLKEDGEVRAAAARQQAILNKYQTPEAIQRMKEEREWREFQQQRGLCHATTPEFAPSGKNSAAQKTRKRIKRTILKHTIRRWDPANEKWTTEEHRLSDPHLIECFRLDQLDHGVRLHIALGIEVKKKAGDTTLFLATPDAAHTPQSNRKLGSGENRSLRQPSRKRGKMIDESSDDGDTSSDDVAGDSSSSDEGCSVAAFTKRQKT